MADKNTSSTLLHNIVSSFNYYPHKSQIDMVAHVDKYNEMDQHRYYSHYQFILFYFIFLSWSYFSNEFSVELKSACLA